MFVRIVWNSGPVLPRKLRDRRSLRHLPRSGCDDLGIVSTDFQRMTKGLFDRFE